jgi:hypothetical protein
MLAELTGIPTVIWGAFWIAAAAVIIAAAVAAAARPRPASPGLATRPGRP